MNEFLAAFELPLPKFGLQIRHDDIDRIRTFDVTLWWVKNSHAYKQGTEANPFTKHYRTVLKRDPRKKGYNLQIFLFSFFARHAHVHQEILSFWLVSCQFGSDSCKRLLVLETVGITMWCQGLWAYVVQVNCDNSKHQQFSAWLRTTQLKMSLNLSKKLTTSSYQYKRWST